MSGGPLERVFPYNFKTIAYTSGIAFTSYVCNRRLFLRIIPPDDLHEWKNLHMELSMNFRQYEGAWPIVIPTAAKVLERIRVIQTLPPNVNVDQPGKQIIMNKAATGFDQIEISVDLTSLINPTGNNWVELVFPAYFDSLSGWGFIGVWKLDALYTTKGIR